MRVTNKYFSLMLGIIAVISQLVLPAASLAVTTPPVKVAPPASAIQKPRDDRTKAYEDAKWLHIAAKSVQRLDATKLSKCQASQESIKRRADNYVRNAQQQLDVFNSQVEKISQFAKSKHISVANKTTLLATIEDKRKALASEMVQIKKDAQEFKCDGNNPKAQLQAFLAQAKLIRTDLKAYRESVRAWLKAVQQANGQKRETRSEINK